MGVVVGVKVGGEGWVWHWERGVVGVAVGEGCGGCGGGRGVW